MRETITGNKRLAAILNVHYNTVTKWKKLGVLDNAILSNFGRIIIYDLEKVYQCLNYKRVTVGRPTKSNTK